MVYWKAFTKAVIKALQDKSDIVWLLMGIEAKNYSPLISNPSHAVIETVHPAADIYSKEDRFYGSSCFKHINEELEARNKSKITW